MKKVYKSLFILHLIVGIGALIGGLAAIIDPYEPLGMPIEPIKNSPFNNYLIPGIILFTILGLGNIFSTIMFRFKSKFQGYVSSIFSWALVIWIVVQCIMIKAVAIPHILFFAIGLIQAFLSMLILFEQRLFPANITLNFYKKLIKNAEHI